jgi:antitoxin (DNA-binding transcriptional repressor) of toxin-antitoxin stability system
LGLATPSLSGRRGTAIFTSKIQQPLGHPPKTHLSKVLERVAKGETIVLAKRNVPIAEIRPLVAPRKSKRHIGLVKGKFRVPRTFFEPLPDALLGAFEGREAASRHVHEPSGRLRFPS